MISIVNKGVKLLKISAERLYDKRAKLDGEMSRVNKKLARLKEQRDDCDLQLGLDMERGIPYRTRDGRVIARQLTEVSAIVATDEWFAENRGKTIRKGYSFPRYEVSEA